MGSRAAVPWSTALSLAPSPSYSFPSLPTGQGAESKCHGAALLHRRTTTTTPPAASAGPRVLQSAGSWGEAWLVPRLLLGWPGPEAKAQSSGGPFAQDSKEGLERTLGSGAELPAAQASQGGRPQQGNRNHEKALQTGTELPLARRTQSWCLSVYIRHSPAPAFVCWSNRLHRKTCSPSSPWALTTNTGHGKAAGPSGRIRRHNYPEFRSEKTQWEPQWNKTHCFRVLILL